VTRFVFFEYRNKVSATCAQLLLGSSGFLIRSRAYFEIGQELEREGLENT
jgi:hypothetical protein